MATLIYLRALTDVLGGSKSHPARFTATPSTASGVAIRIEHDAVTFPATVQASFDGTSWDHQPALTQLPAGCYWSVHLYPEAGSALSRTVQLPPTAGGVIDFSDLVDVDPHSAAPTPTQLSVWLTALDQKIATQAALDAATFLPRWKANTTYIAGTIAVNPSGQIVRRKADGTSSASYDPTAWDIVAGGVGGGGAVNSVAGRTGDIVLTKADSGLGNVDNTSDTAKPISTATQAALDAKAPAAALAGKADLVGGVVPTSQIPSLALNTVVPVASRTAMLALTSGQVQPGDVAVDTSTGATRGSYMLLNTDPSVIGSWVQLTAPTDVVTSVNSQTGAVVLGKADVGLSNVDNTSDANKPVSTAQQTALNAKVNTTALAPVATSGAYSDLTGKPAGGTAPDVQVFTTPGTFTWTKPAGCTVVKVTLLGGGGGGGSGARVATSVSGGGGAGGAGGGFHEQQFPASLLGATETVVVGAAGAGGAAQSTDASSGTSGASGGLSRLGLLARAGGGGGGSGGGANGNVGGPTGGGGATIGGGGGGANAGQWGFDGGTSYGGGNGGGAGGGISGGTQGWGGRGAGVFAIGAATMSQQSPGTSGPNGQAGNPNAPIGGGGGGGGGSSATAPGVGGAGAAPAGAGGGGGASQNGAASGKGGDGAGGIVIVISW